MSIRLLIPLLCLLALVAFGAGHARDRRPDSSGGYAAATLVVDGVERRYLVRRPRGQRPPTAIVLMLHGGGGSAERLTGEAGNAAPYRAWHAIADREGLLLVAPQGADGNKGAGKPGWNDCRNLEDSGQDADDVVFLTALVDALRRAHGVSSTRTFAIGTSNGGMMALRLAIERPQTFTAVASVASSMPADTECAAPSRAVPVLMINGTEDPLMPYEGGAIARQFGDRGTALPVQASIRIWAQLAGTTSRPETVFLPDTDPNDGSRATREIFAARQGRADVELIRIDGGGHVEPSRTQRYARFVARLLGRQNGDIEMADEAWAFFREHGR